MRLRQIIILSVLGFLACPGFGLDVTIDKSASTGARFLNIPASARYTAMGNAGTALAGGAESIFVNPAGSFDGGNGIMAAHDSWLDGVFMENAAVNYRLMKGMGIGAAFSYVNEGSTDKYAVDVYGNPVKQGQVSGNAFIMKGNYSLNFLNFLSAGINIGFAGESLGESVSGAFVTDLGLRYKDENGFGAGITAKNMGTKIDKYDLSVPVSAGVSYSRIFSKMHSINTAVEFKSDLGSNSVYGIGLEYGFMETYFARVGYSTDNTDPGTGLSGIRAGAGIKFEKCMIDYSFEPYGELGVSNKIALSVIF